MSSKPTPNGGRLAGDNGLESIASVNLLPIHRSLSLAHIQGAANGDPMILPKGFPFIIEQDTDSLQKSHGILYS